MDKVLMERDFKVVTDDRARDVYLRLCGACDAREGGMQVADQQLIGDYARAEQLKYMLDDDIIARGIGKERHNGRQSYWEENKSISRRQATIEQQRKLLAELKLSAQSRKADVAPVVVDDFDEFVGG